MTTMNFPSRWGYRPSGRFHSMKLRTISFASWNVPGGSDWPQIDEFVAAVLLHQRSQLVGHHLHAPQIFLVELGHQFAFLTCVAQIERKNRSLGSRGNRPRHKLSRQNQCPCQTKCRFQRVSPFIWDCWRVTVHTRGLGRYVHDTLAGLQG